MGYTTFGLHCIRVDESWEPGERSEVSWYGEGTGPWHDNLRQSTGITAPRTEYPPLEDSPRLAEMYERSLPLYDAMAAHMLDPTASASGRRPLPPDRSSQ